MSFYIKIDNPHNNRPVDAPSGGSPVEGPSKVCLVTAFTAVVGSRRPAYEPDIKYAGRDYGYVSVELAGENTVVLPFPAGEFEEIVLDAQQHNRIADFTSEHWTERLDDLVVLRNRHSPAMP